MPKLVPFEVVHAREAYPNLRSDIKYYSLDEFIHYTTSCSQVGKAFTAIDDDGKIIGMGGIIRIHKYSGHCWLALTDDIKQNRFWFHRMMKKTIVPLMNLMGLVRMEAEVDAEHPDWIKWAKVFGFADEGLMRKFGVDGTDFLRIAYIKEDKK